MHSRWFNAAVILLWLSSMGWLLVEKVLPPMLVGHPPSYRTILEAQQRDPLVGWMMRFDDRPLGWALSTTSSLPDDITEVRSWVHFDQLPLDDLTPGLLRALLRLVEQPVGNLEMYAKTMDAKNAVLIDPLGRLSSFRSEVRVMPLDSLITMQGTIEGTQLKLEINAGGLPYETERPIPRQSLLSDALSPQTQLPGIRPGQTWTVPVYSPLNLNRPVEVLKATVEGTDPIVWNDRTVETLLVVYRSDPGYGLGGNDRPRGKLWVRPDGTVLKQHVMIYNSTMTFIRLPDDRAAALKRKVERDEEAETTSPEATSPEATRRVGADDRI